MNKETFCTKCKWYNIGIDTCQVGQKSKTFTTYERDYKGKTKKVWQNFELWKRFFPHGDEQSGRDTICNANRDRNCPFFKRRWYILTGPRKGPIHLVVELLKDDTKSHKS
jgi:hypothetical protein